MKSLAILSVTALLALSSTAYAGGYHNSRSSFLSPSVGLSLGNIGVLNNSSILSGILSGNNGLLNILGGSRQSNGNVINSHNGNKSHNGNNSHNNNNNGNNSHNGNGSHNGNNSHNGNHSHNRNR